jgi:fatty acid CoA ligase FadD9
LRAEVVREQTRASGGQDGTPSQVAFETVRNKYSKLAGPSIRQITIGGAKPSPDSMAWMKLVFGEEKVAESYGISEVGGIADGGKVLDGVEVKLQAWGEFSPDDTPYPRGELLVRTKEVVIGYVGQEATSRNAFDAEGYFRTGDIVEMAPVVADSGLEGQPFQPDMAWAYRLNVVDRKSNMLKLSAGEFVAPAALEQVYAQGCTLVDMIFVHGEMGGVFLTAVIVIDMGAACLWAAESDESTNDLASNSKLRQAVLGQLRDSASSAGLRPFEVPRAVFLTTEPFTIANGLLNPTGKFSRRMAAKHYSTELEAMGGESTGVEEGEEDGAQVFSQERLIRRLGSLVAAALAGQQLAAQSEDTTPLNLLGVDSVGVITLCSRIDHDVSGAFGGVSVQARVLAAPQSDLSLVSLRELIVAQLAPTADSTSANDAIDWAAECSVPESLLQPLSAAESETRSQPAPKGVLITGVTGFLGAAVLQQTLRSAAFEGSSVYCLVRPPRGALGHELESAATQRLQEEMQKQGCWDDSMAVALSAGRLKVMPGDAAADWLGVVGGEQAFHTLGTSVSVIIHMASMVNHAYGYRAMKQVNVDAMNTIVALARIGGAAVQYCSTISVLSDDDASADNAEAKEGSAAAIEAVGGYAQTKWVAEQRLRCAANAGVIGPALILRPGLITPATADGQTPGATNMKDWLTRFVHGAIQVGGYGVLEDETETDGVMYITAVDHAADCVCAFASQLHAGTLPEVSCSTRHLPLTVSMGAREWLQMIARSPHLAAAGHKMRALTQSEWSAAMDSLPESNPLFVFRATHRLGLGGIAGHGHAAATAALAGAVPGSDRLVQPPLPYTQADVDAMVQFVLAHG